jgi:hypothetical protein
VDNGSSRTAQQERRRQQQKVSLTDVGMFAASMFFIVPLTA